MISAATQETISEKLAGTQNEFLVSGALVGACEWP